MDHELNRDELGAFISVTPNDIPAVQDTIYDESKSIASNLAYSNLKKIFRRSRVKVDSSFPH
jgi:hypothetical protein